MACTDECVRPTPAQAHCSLCHVTFSGPWTFDEHRRSGKCARPQINGMTEKRGVWGNWGTRSAAAILARQEAQDRRESGEVL